MRKPLRETLRLSAFPRDARVERVLAPEVAREAELNDARRGAYERGRIEGEQALGEMLVRQRQETQELFHGVLQSLRDAVPQVIRDTERAAVTLAFEIARRIVSDLPISVEMVEAAVREALAQIEQATEFTVLVHPADLELLQRTQSPLLAPGTEARPIRFHATTEVTRGGCVVQTRFGTIDARRETKFDLLKQSLLA
jgi:flagellar biosynthesis/type III secretory pathway protein FliH